MDNWETSKDIQAYKELKASVKADKDLEAFKGGYLDLQKKVTDITTIKGSQFNVKDIGKALVHQNKAIIANISSMSESITALTKSMNSLIVLKRAELQLKRDELKENSLYHKYMQLNTKDISKRLIGLGIALDKTVISNHHSFKPIELEEGDYSIHKDLNLQEYLDEIDHQYKIWQKEIQKRLKRS